MKYYAFQNTLISKKQLKDILSWTFTNYGSVRASVLSEELKSLGFQYSTKAGISISIEDLKIPSIKKLMIEKSNNEICNSQKNYLSGQITEVERLQKIINTWDITSEALKEKVVSYFNNYDPLNSVYMMAFSGARGNLSQVRQLVGMRGLMSDPHGEIMDSPIKQNFREGLTITDYLMSGYGARKGVVDTSLKTANSGYLTRRLIDVAQDMIIREKDCKKSRSIEFVSIKKDTKIIIPVYDRILGRILSTNIYDFNNSKKIIVNKGTPITLKMINFFKQNNIQRILLRSPLTCGFNKSICQNCYGWNLANEDLVDLGEAIGIVAGQSIGEPGTQLTMRTFHTGGIFTSSANKQIISPVNGIAYFSKSLKTSFFRTPQGENVLQAQSSGSVLIKTKKGTVASITIPSKSLIFITNNCSISKDDIIGQIVDSGKQVKYEKKDVLSKFSGEVYSNKDGLIWIFRGKIVKITKNAFFKFSKNLCVLRDSFIWRTKIIQKTPGLVKILSDTRTHLKHNLQILKKTCYFKEITINNLINYSLNTNKILNFLNLKFLLLSNVQINQIDSISLNEDVAFGKILNNNFITVTGGSYHFLENKLKKPNFVNTFLWASKETHTTNIIGRTTQILNVENSEYVNKNFEIIPNIYTKVAGVLKISQKDNIIQEIQIYPGVLHKIKNFKKFQQKIFYPGEIIFNCIKIIQISMTEIVETRNGKEIIIRPISIYQIPKIFKIQILLQNNIFKLLDTIKFSATNQYNFTNNNSIEGIQPLHLMETKIRIHYKKNKQTQDLSLLINKNNNNQLILGIAENIYLNKYIPTDLTKSDILISLPIKNNQFINAYSIVGYIQTNSNDFTKFIKLRTNIQTNSNKKRLLCINKNDCLQISKKILNNYKINDIVVNKKINKEIIGRIIDKKDSVYIIQKGQLYFFPINKDIFCNNGDLIEKHQTIGQLYFEKEITGDIIQGLPKIEQILESRRAEWREIKELDISKKIFFLTQYDFLKQKRYIHWIERALLEGHTNLYTMLALNIRWYLKRLSIYEASYRSIKKIQQVILNSIQSIYRAQGVNISDKHLEIIIKQMTSKVKILSEGNTPLLQNELIDLYHIRYINTAVALDKKKIAAYIPVILGITKTSLNSDSFLSAASFQETTRVLTKSAIEGKVDWLRGLKENVIIGDLLPIGTGSIDYKTVIV